MYEFYKSHQKEVQFKYIYKNDAPHGKNVSIEKDDFYKKYHIKFFNENQTEIHIALTKENFEYYGIKKELWSVKYKGSIYKIVNFELDDLRFRR